MYALRCTFGNAPFPFQVRQFSSYCEGFNRGGDKEKNEMNFLKRLLGSGGSESISSQRLQEDERLSTKCILCGALLRPAARGLYAELFTGTSIKCTSGHKALYWHGNNMWYTEDDDVAQRLQAKGFKVVSSPHPSWFCTRHFIET